MELGGSIGHKIGELDAHDGPGLIFIFALMAIVAAARRGIRRVWGAADALACRRDVGFFVLIVAHS